MFGGRQSAMKIQEKIASNVKKETNRKELSRNNEEKIFGWLLNSSEDQQTKLSDVKMEAERIHGKKS